MKKTLLVAAAALAAGIISSQAQVYSQNIVGYVNQSLSGGNALVMLANPLIPSSGTNDAEQALPSMTGGENILVWNGHGYYAYSYFGAGVGTGLGFPSDFIDLNGGTASAIPGDVFDSANNLYWTQPLHLNQGQGFFLQNPNSNETNTYVGQAVLQTTNTPVVLTGGNALVLVSSAVPIGGNIQGTNFNLPFQGGENVFVWNGHGYYAYSFFGTGVGTGLGYPSDFIDLNGGTASAIPGDVFDSNDNLYWTQPLTVSVGQGYFIQNPNSTENWTQNLNVQ